LNVYLWFSNFNQTKICFNQNITVLQFEYEFTLMRIVSLDVSDVMSGELVDGLLDLGEASLLAHGQGREVSVGAGAVPISLLKAIKNLYFAK
jgi:hypothetical protein